MGRLTCRAECFPKGLSLGVSVIVLGTGVYSGDLGSCQHSAGAGDGWASLSSLHPRLSCQDFIVPRGRSSGTCHRDEESVVTLPD